MIALWLTAVWRRRPAQQLAVVAGVALAVGLIVILGLFTATSHASMTRRASSTVAVDWQVQVARGSDAGSAAGTVRRTPGVQQQRTVQYGLAESFSSAVGGTIQQTGAAVVLGLPGDYSVAFPKQIRYLTGARSGVLLAQQTAANLHAVPGDVVSVKLAGGAAATMRIAGVVDLPQADALFQTVGAAAGSQPAAPPDNVLLLPAADFTRLYGGHGDLVTTQIHVRRTHALPADPAEAFVATSRAANHLSAALAGRGIVADDLGAALSAARSDAAYAQVLFLFLGAPGVVLAGLLTLAVAAADRPRQRADQALLRLRGATDRQILVLAAAETVLDAVLGAATGLVLAGATGALVFGGGALTGDPATVVTWCVAGVLVGVAVAALAVLAPTARDLRATTVVQATRSTDRAERARWRKILVAVLLLAVAAVLVATTTRPGYSLVLVPEGVATISVDYWAFAGPALIWVGGASAAGILVQALLARRRVVARIMLPLTGGIASPAAASYSRRAGRIARSAVLVAVAVAFAVSTSVFTATYQQQARVDAQLTNGADVHVIAPPGVTPPAGLSGMIAGVSGVRRAEAVQHRFAYVGADLQDLYGIDPATIGSVTNLQDGYFVGGTARQLLDRLRAVPDGVLVSQETAVDYQLHLGSRVTLRVVDAATKAESRVSFRYIGQVLEFPTAPRDSFLVANAAYLAHTTGVARASDVLVATDGTPPAAVAQRISARLGTGYSVTPIGASRAAIGSSLTSVDLTGLTRVELAFALLLGAAAGGLVLLVDGASRRRTLAVLAILGGSPGQRRSIVLAESALTVAAGLLLGAALGATLAATLVGVLSGVFDPPPSMPAVPWGYFVALAALIAGFVLAAAFALTHRTSRPAIELTRAG